MNAEKALDEVAQDIIHVLGEIHIVCLYGDLGSGKTTFVKYLARALGVADEVTSPTYSLIHAYPHDDPRFTGPLYHLDLYRLDSLQEALDIGIEEYLHSGALCCIEWPDVIIPILPLPYLEIQIIPGSASARKIRILKRED